MKEHKLIITGVGRCGTTFLVRLLTELGLDTGFCASNLEEKIYKNCNSGLEFLISDILHNNVKTPYILKSPYFCDRIPMLYDKYEIDMVFVLERDIEDAAASRMKIGKNQPGGCWNYNNLSDLKNYLEKLFNTLIGDLNALSIPYKIIKFPQLVEDSEYLFLELQPYISEYNYALFKNKFDLIKTKTKSNYYK